MGRLELQRGDFPPGRQVACVTGGTGFLGRRVVSQLLGEGYQVRCLIREASDPKVLQGMQESFEDLLTIVTGSLNHPETVRKFLSGGEIVYHLAASLQGTREQMRQSTIEPTKILTAEAADLGVKRFVLVSSLGVYDVSRLPRLGLLDETCPLETEGQRRDIYTFSKLAQEQICWEAYKNIRLPLVVIRPGVIYGPGRSPLTSRVGLTLGGVCLQMGGGQQLPYTQVANCAAAVVKAGMTSGIEGEAFNIVDSELPTGSQILKALTERGQRKRVVPIPETFIQPLSALNEFLNKFSLGRIPTVLTRSKSQSLWKPLVYSTDKARRRLGWSPEVCLADGLSEAIEAQSPSSLISKSD